MSEMAAGVTQRVAFAPFEGEDSTTSAHSLIKIPLAVTMTLFSIPMTSLLLPLGRALQNAA